jgi:hypothetical protein
MPSPPRGAAEASTMRLTRPGRVSVISCATKLPIEKPDYFLRKKSVGT